MVNAPDTDASVEIARTLKKGVQPAHADRRPNGSIVGGRARVKSFLASGGFGDVYLAEDLSSREEVVLKIMQLERAPDAAALKRFVLEAAAAAAVRHPAIVRVFHVDVDQAGAPFLLCERVEGRTLKSCLHDGPVPLAALLALGAIIADALAAVHRAGLVHRDIKPDNIMVGKQSPGARLLDFGVSRWQSEEFQLTDAGALIGSVGYMAPEQIAAREAPTRIGPAADVFALGLTLYQCLAGQHPLEGAHPLAVLQRLGRADLPPIRETCSDVPPDVAAFITQTLAASPEDRPTMATIASELRTMRGRHGAMNATAAAALLLSRTEQAPNPRASSVNATTVADSPKSLKTGTKA
jgi:eukaryotic-like serine/threonine-protein kinase